MLMKIKPFTNLCLIILISAGFAYGQSGIVSGGGDASGSSGTASFSFGMLDYGYSSSTAGSITAGVQQPFVIVINHVVELSESRLSIKVFPNPAHSFAHIEIADADYEHMTYRIFDVNGRFIIERKPLEGNLTTVNLERLPPGMYFLEIFEKNKRIEVFRLIKK
jgi:hypothetical protein